MEYIQGDEAIEVTPKSIRLRKLILDENERKRKENQAATKPLVTIFILKPFFRLSRKGFFLFKFLFTTFRASLSLKGIYTKQCAVCTATGRNFLVTA